MSKIQVLHLDKAEDIVEKRIGGFVECLGLRLFESLEELASLYFLMVSDLMFCFNGFHCV